MWIRSTVVNPAVRYEVLLGRVFWPFRGVNTLRYLMELSQGAQMLAFYTLLQYLRGAVVVVVIIHCI